MKQGNIITKVIMLIFLVAVLAYLGYSVFSAIYDPLTTTTAVACTAGESYNTTLWLVREESPVLSEAYITSLSLADGEKVPAGGEVAQGYRNELTYERQQELEQMQERLERAQWEMAQRHKYDEVVINENVDECAGKILSIIAEKADL